MMEAIDAKGLARLAKDFFRKKGNKVLKIKKGFYIFAAALKESVHRSKFGIESSKGLNAKF